jgi:hypothetical protein
MREFETFEETDEVLFVSNVEMCLKTSSILSFLNFLFLKL